MHSSTYNPHAGLMIGPDYAPAPGPTGGLDVVQKPCVMLLCAMVGIGPKRILAFSAVCTPVWGSEATAITGLVEEYVMVPAAPGVMTAAGPPPTWQPMLKV